MTMKIESAKITIKGKEYKFLKPSAVDIIEIEDKCINPDGGLDESKYSELMLGMVTKDVKVSDLVKFNSEPIEMSSGESVVIPEVGYDKWIEAMRTVETFSRIKLAKIALRMAGVSGEPNMRGFKYEDIDRLAMGVFTLYDSSELREVIEEISTFCM